MQLLKRRSARATAYVLHRSLMEDNPEVSGFYTPIIGVVLSTSEAVEVGRRNLPAEVEWTELPIESLEAGDSPSLLYLGVEVGPLPEGVLTDPTPRAAFTNLEAARRWGANPGPSISRPHVIALPVGLLDWSGSSWTVM